MRLLQEAGPARYPGVDGGRAEVGRHCFGSLACQKPKQLGSLCTEPASHQPATARPAELGVGVAAFVPGMPAADSTWVLFTGAGGGGGTSEESAVPPTACCTAMDRMLHLGRGWPELPDKRLQ